ncbi:MAG: signal recognition particle-docking protein FtsY [Chloroflexi bacterium RBG_13_53_26]|nr:MAG: signal recognition particle-docking protein FtsY [Chloroflexi bacterium RBG_13_53_26]
MLFNLFKKKTEEAVKRSKDTWFGKITRLFERSSIEEETWEELEELLIAADTGVETATRLTQRVKDRVSKEKISDVQQVRATLMQEMASILKVNGKGPAVTGAPRVILVVGVNGSGKTTSIAKLGYNFKRDGDKVMLAAGDTFRAAAIEQLKWWGERIGAEVIAHQQGADPGAVVFDALQAAKNRGVQAVIVDTAGRLHTKFNLMEELKKIRRVIQRIDPSAPHETLLVLDATTGQNGLSQAKHFTEAVGVSGIILTKLDSTAKGGIVLAICDQLKIPVRFIGTGEQLDDLAPFDPQTFVEAIMS